MASNPLHRRLLVGVLSTGLLAGVLVPLTSASAASCASWSDAKGDSTTSQTGNPLLADSQLDIVSAALGTVGKDVVGTITTDGLGSSSSDAGDEFRFRFTIAEQDVILYVDRTAPLGEELDITAGFFNFTSRTSGDATAEFDVKTKTVKLIGPIDELTKAVGKPARGLALTNLRAETLNQVLFGSRNPNKYDEAVTPAKPVVGTACTLGGAPAPAGSAPASPAAGASPSPAGSPAASPSASSSASPAGSPSSSAAPSGSPSPSTSPPPPQPTVPVPAAGCFGFADPKGDARPSGQAPNDPDLDIVAVTGRTTEEALAGHLQIDKLGSRPALPVFSGHRFEYQFTVGEKVVLLRANETGEGVGLVNGTTAPDLKVTAVFDVVSSQVVLSVDRESLATVLGGTVPDGSFLTALTGRSAARTAAPVLSPADTATSEDPVRGTYTVGDNTCFAPKLSVSLPGEVQTSDRAPVSVSMTTSDGRAAAGQRVTARIGDGRAVSATSDKQGNVTLLVPVTDAAGTHLLFVRSRGSAGSGELSSPLDVVVERTVLRTGVAGSGPTRTVTATLTDDDRPRRALAGQRLVFRFADSSVSAVTDSTGRASARVPAGSVVEVAYAGRRGFLTAATARTTAR